MSGAELLADALSLRAGSKVSCTAHSAATTGACRYGRAKCARSLARHVAESDNQRRLLEDVAETFDLEAVPQRIEVFDNSHLQGTNQIGGMIVAGSEVL